MTVCIVTELCNLTKGNICVCALSVCVRVSERLTEDVEVLGVSRLDQLLVQEAEEATRHLHHLLHVEEHTAQAH